MSKAHEEPGHTPLKNYLLEAIYRSNLPAREVKVLLMFARLTYGWIDSEDRTRRCDRVTASYTELADDVGMYTRDFRRVLKSLVEKKIITVFEAGSGRRAGTYGINSDPECWSVVCGKLPQTNKNRSVRQTAAPREGQTAAPREGQTAPQKSAANQHGYAPQSTPKESIKERFKEIQSDEEAQTPVVEITTVEQAKAAKNLTRDELKKSASWFIKHFWRRPILSVIQEHDLAAFFDANPDVEARLLLAILILAAEGEMKTRTLRKQNGQEQFVSKRPIDTTIENAKTLLAEKLMTVREQQSQAEHYEDWTDPEPETRQRRESATIHPLTTKTTQTETKEQQQWTDSTPRWKCG